MSAGAFEHKSFVLLVAVVASFITPFMVSSVVVALPRIGGEFSLGAVALGWVPTAYILASAVFLVPFGKLADVHGRKKFLLWGMSIYSAATLGCALAPAAAPFIVCRIVQGIGAAMIFGTSTAIVTSVYGPGERGRALGVTTAATYVGLSLGPAVGGFLTQHLGWRSIFFVSVPLGAADIALILLRLRGEWAEARGERFDTAGSALFGLSLAAIMYGFSRLPAALGGWLILAGAIGLAAFAGWERRARSPLLDMRLLSSNRVFAFSNLAALINYSASNAVTFLMSLYLQYLKALTPQAAGFVLLAQPIMMAAFSPLAGRLSDRVESRVVASTGMAILTASLAAFVFLGAGTPLIWIILNFMLLGFGFALFSSPNTNAVMSSVEPRLFGVAAATLATMRMTGQMFSMGIAMLMLAVSVGTARIAPDRYLAFLTAVKSAFIIFASLSVVGVFASLARGNVRRGAASA
jgi:EmrB/QacA subfamily drug resistance transporter